MKTAAVLLADVRSWRQGICPLPLSPFLEICHPRKGEGEGAAGIDQCITNTP